LTGDVGRDRGDAGRALLFFAAARFVDSSDGLADHVRGSSTSRDERRNPPLLAVGRQVTRSLSSGAHSRDPLANPPYAGGIVAMVVGDP